MSRSAQLSVLVVIQNSYLTMPHSLNYAGQASIMAGNSQNSISKIVSEYDQEIPQSQTADNPVAPRGRAAQPSRDTRKTHKAKQPALSSPSSLCGCIKLGAVSALHMLNCIGPHCTVNIAEKCQVTYLNIEKIRVSVHIF